jgi:glycosyltransferase involved in cell wall biosynthesis
LISPEYPPFNIGGGGVVYKNLSKQLRNKGHSVDVVAGNFTNKQIVGKVAITQEETGLTVNFVPLFPLNSKNANLATYTPPTIGGLLFMLKKIIRSSNGAIHLHGFCHPTIDLAAAICILLRKKYVITCHGIPKIPKETSKLVKIAFTAYLALIERPIVQKAAALTTVSKSLKNECANNQLINKSTSVIPNGANLSLSPIEPNAIQALEEKYLLKNKPVIFAIGRLSENKGFQFLVEAMQYVVRSSPEAVAFIAGFGAYRRELENLISAKGLRDNVRLLGWISDQEKTAFYQRADVMVFPSTNEPFGIVLLEASIMHKPIVGFDIASTKEILPKGTGLLVPVGDSPKLGQAIIEVISDPTLKSKLSAESEKVRASSWENISVQYLNIYQNINMPIMVNRR